MNSRARRKFIRKCDLKMRKNQKLSIKELVSYSNIFCTRYPDNWLNRAVTEEERAAFADRSDSVPWD